MSLRAELIGASGGMPAFAVLLPDGWQASDAAGEGLRERMDAVLAGFPPAARTALRAQVDEMLASVSTSAKDDIVRVFAPSASSPEDFLPVTIVASWLRAPAGGSIQQIGAGLIATRGAQPVGEAGAILRWPIDDRLPLEGGRIEVAGAGYLLPVPGAPTVGLLFRSQILRSAGGSTIAEDGIRAMSAISDAIVASVRWRRDG